MIRCAQCGLELPAGTRCVASISGSMLGDEWSETWFLCDSCGTYSVKVCCEPFLGDETVSVRGPISKAESEAQLALIRRCETPWDKKCRCEAHRAYFRDQLD